MTPSDYSPRFSRDELMAFIGALDTIDKIGNEDDVDQIVRIARANNPAADPRNNPGTNWDRLDMMAKWTAELLGVPREQANEAAIQVYAASAAREVFEEVLLLADGYRNGFDRERRAGILPPQAEYVAPPDPPQRPAKPTVRIVADDQRGVA
jgi:hypothetical protein